MLIILNELSCICNPSITKLQGILIYELSLVNGLHLKILTFPHNNYYNIRWDWLHFDPVHHVLFCHLQASIFKLLQSWCSYEHIFSHVNYCCTLSQRAATASFDSHIYLYDTSKHSSNRSSCFDKNDLSKQFWGC